MSVNREGRSRFKCADVTTCAVGSRDATLVSQRTSSSISAIHCWTAGKKRDRRGGTAIITQRTKFGIGAVQTAWRGKVTACVRNDIVTSINEVAKAVTTRRTVGQDRGQNG